jgi:rSAM/selenodomain-associated transferase 2
LISVVIPVLNEQKALPETLRQVLNQDEESQVIVVDGGSTDNTQQQVENLNNVEWLISAPGRARQMNVGAQASTGDWLLFLHADTWLPEGALQTINSLDRTILAGGFCQQFSKHHWFLKLVSQLHNWRCRRSRIIYGDQCLFIRRTLFEKIGGFPEQTILEDVLISERILEHTRPVLLEQLVITSSRKFEQRGLFRSFFDIVVIMCCHELRLPVFRRGFFAPFR